MNRCSMCLTKEKNVDHLFIHCSVFWKVWNFFLSQVGGSWVFPSTFKDLISKYEVSPPKKGSQSYLESPSEYTLLVPFGRKENERSFEPLRDDSNPKKVSWWLFEHSV